LLSGSLKEAGEGGIRKKKFDHGKEGVDKGRYYAFVKKEVSKRKCKGEGALTLEKGLSGLVGTG